MKKILFLLFSFLLGLQANTHLKIYTNKFFITETFLSNKKVELKIPSYINLEDLRYKAASDCSLTSQELSKTKELDNEESKRLKTLLKQEEDLQIKKKSLVAKENLLTSLSLKQEFDTKKIEKISSFLQNSIVKIENETTTIERKLQEIQKQIKALKTNIQKYKSLYVNFTCKKQQPINISYESKDLSYKPFYEIYADTSTNSLEIINKASLLYKGFLKLKNIQIDIFSNRYDANIAPAPFYPQYLYQPRQINETRKKILKSTSFLAKAMSDVKRADLETLYSYSISNVSLTQNSPKILPLESQKIAAKYDYVIDAYGTNKAYVKADFKPTKTYVGGKAKLFFNSIAIGKIYLKKLDKGIEDSLYFGQNQFVHVKKELVKTTEEKSFFSGKTSKRKWKYTLSNANTQTLNITFITKTPVSKDADITVETIAKPAFSSQNAEGKTSWKLRLSPNQSKEIIFGYEINKNK